MNLINEIAMLVVFNTYSSGKMRKDFLQDITILRRVKMKAIKDEFGVFVGLWGKSYTMHFVQKWKEDHYKYLEEQGLAVAISSFDWDEFRFPAKKPQKPCSSLQEVVEVKKQPKEYQKLNKDTTKLRR